MKEVIENKKIKEGKVVLLSRVSTEYQCFESQTNELKEWVRSHGFGDADMIIIEDKESGSKLSDEQRQGLSKLYQTIKNENVIAVYALELSRLSRRSDTLHRLINILTEKKIDLRIKDKNIKLLNDRYEVDEAAELIFSIYIQFCKSENRQRVERTIRGKKKNAMDGKYIGGNRKFGYTFKQSNKFNDNEGFDIPKDIDNFTYIEHPEEGKIVRDIYRLYSEGNGTYGVYKTIKQLYNTKITHSTIGKILRDPSYTGKVREAKVVNRGHGYLTTRCKRTYPILIDNETFEKCRNVANSNSTNLTKTKTVYYSHRLIKCCCCNDYLKAFKAKMIYKCKNTYNPIAKIQCKSKDTININVVDHLVWETAKAFEAKSIQNIDEQKIFDLKAQLETVQIKLNNNSIIYENAILEKMTEFAKTFKKMTEKERRAFAIRELVDKKAEIDTEKAQFQNEISRLTSLIEKIESNTIKLSAFEQSKSRRNQAIQLEYIIEESDDSKRKEIIRQHIREVRVYNEPNKVKRIEIFVHKNPTPFIYHYAAMKPDKKKRLYVWDPSNNKVLKYIDYTERLERNYTKREPKK